MKNSLCCILAASCLLVLAGCATCDIKCSEKVDALSSRIDTLEAKVQTLQPTQNATISASAETTMPTQIPAAAIKIPTKIEIQSALKNAGFYAGDVDGKLGPKTKEAIENFQKSNGLAVDGKVGSETWNKLAAYLPIEE
ncbi:MAG: peptidoglycan-binding domain-containing protein [Candidatus Omnitrophota bacterium]